jgi:hypothetical protein
VIRFRFHVAGLIISVADLAGFGTVLRLIVVLIAVTRVIVSGARRGLCPGRGGNAGDWGRFVVRVRSRSARGFAIAGGKRLLTLGDPRRRVVPA